MRRGNDKESNVATMGGIRAGFVVVFFGLGEFEIHRGIESVVFFFFSFFFLVWPKGRQDPKVPKVL